MTLSPSSQEGLKSSRPYHARILGLGTALPLQSIAQADSAMIAQELHITKRWHQALPVLYRKTGVHQRGSVLLTSDSNGNMPRQSFYQASSLTNPYGPTTAERMQIYAKESTPLLMRACVAAMAQSCVSPSSVTHLITVSCTGFAAPGSDLQLIEKIGLSPNVQRLNVGFMGCHGAINAIRVAKAIVESDCNAVVLVGAVELCSIHQQYTDDPQQLVANALFADGAAAMMVGTGLEDEQRHDLELKNEAFANWEITSTFSQVIPRTSNLMSWNIGDYGFQMSLDPQVPACIESYLHSALSTWLGSQSLTVGSIDSWAIHPGGPRIVQASGESLGLTREQIAPSLYVLANHGNMSSPTVLFIFDELTRINPDAKHAVLLAFGPGLCIEACLCSIGSDAS